MTMTPSLGTRAVVRNLQAGRDDSCIFCEVQLRWNARRRQKVVVANVYEDGKWDRLEWFHVACYQRADEPHGPMIMGDQWPPAGDGFLYGSAAKPKNKET